MEILTVKQLLEQAESRKKKDRCDQFIDQLIRDTINKKISWLINDGGKTVTASLENFGVEVEEERTYDESETICDGVIYRLSLYAFQVGTDRQIVSIETGVPNSLAKLFELAKRQSDRSYASVFVMIDEYFENVKRREAVDMLVKLYDAFKKQ